MWWESHEMLPMFPFISLLYPFISRRWMVGKQLKVNCLILP